ncbi:pentapeptide repeat-containing protein [Enterococcus faecium]|uniref:pentapeptide repeat-containing protein n=1 Tax=Enterococcus faecium TaxID=1352 RepID=UPI0009B5A7ED|nr:pentapeptide repeat-containing protein [Enterococcus faecium]
MEITDCIFENCDFSGCILTKSMLHRVKFVNCKLTGLDNSPLIANGRKLRSKLFMTLG